MATYTDAFPLNNRMSQVEELHSAINRLVMAIESDNIVAREADPESVNKAPNWTTLVVQAANVATGIPLLPVVTLVAISVDAT